MAITAINTGYVVQDANGAFYIGHGKFSNKLEDAKIYKRKKNALENVEWQVEAAKSSGVCCKTFAEPFKLLKVTVNWTAVEIDESKDKPKSETKCMDDEGYSMDDVNIVDVIHTEDYGDIEIGSWEDFEDDTIISDVDC